MGTSLFAGCRKALDVGTDRVAREDNLFGGEVAVHIGIGHTDARRFPGEGFVGQTRIGVLLLQQGGDIHTRGDTERGLAGEASYAYHNIGTEPAQDASHHAAASEHLEGELEILDNIGKGELTLKTGDGQPLDGVASSRHLLHLHAASSPDKKDVGLGMTLFDGICYGQCGKDVSACASSADDDFHDIVVV